MKNKLYILFVFVAIGIFSSCKKDESVDYKKSGFNSYQEFLDNPDIQKAIEESRITIYKGTNPPNIEGEYRTDECTVVSASANLSYSIGLPLGSIFKFSNQTLTTVEISEITDIGESVYGSGAFITGSGMNFTLWIEAHQSSGADIVALMSGTVLSNRDIKIDNITLYTNNPPQDLIIGDWWESVGPLKLKQTYGYCKYSEIDCYGNDVSSFRASLIDNDILGITYPFKISELNHCFSSVPTWSDNFKFYIISINGDILYESEIVYVSSFQVQSVGYDDSPKMYKLSSPVIVYDDFFIAVELTDFRTMPFDRNYFTKSYGKTTQNSNSYNGNSINDIITLKHKNNNWDYHFEFE